MKTSNYLTLVFIKLSLTLPVRLWAQDIDQVSVSPDGHSILKEVSSDTWAIFDREGLSPGQASVPKHRGYDQMLAVWSPDSQKVALIARKLKVSDLYLLAAQGADNIPDLPIEQMKQLVIDKIQATLRGSPHAYKFFPVGPADARWISATELEVQTKFVLALQLDFRVGANPDIRDCRFSYVLDLTGEPALKQLQLLSVQKSPNT
jgi:hypothetical protein